MSLHLEKRHLRKSYTKPLTGFNDMDPVHVRVHTNTKNTIQIYVDMIATSFNVAADHCVCSIL